VPFLLAIAIAGLTSMVFSVLIGFPALRVQGPWLAFVTLAFNLLVFLVLNNEEGLTEGSRGIRIPRSDVTVFGIDLFSSRNYFYFCLAFLVAATAVVWWIVRSPWGRAFKALRDNPARAASLGVDIRTYTLLAFSIGAGLAGVAGALYARLIEFVDPRGFYIGQSFDFFLATVVGGLGTLLGPFIGVSFITVLTDRLRIAGDYYRVWFGLFVVVMMLVAPKGVAGSFNQLRALVQKRLSRRRRDVESQETS
jgi:branched-chain amino acid transport system permease protein